VILYVRTVSDSNKCDWYEGYPYQTLWGSRCGGELWLDDGPEGKFFNFCPFCGKPIGVNYCLSSGVSTTGTDE